MAVIHVPRPPKSAHDPERPANALLIAQVTHLQHAERRLPLRYRSEIYSHAIRTEGEAAKYIHDVTEAIHKAHDDAAAERAKRKKGLRIAASAEPTARRGGSKAKTSKAKAKSSGKRGRKK